MASSGWEDMTEADARRLGKQEIGSRCIQHIPVKFPGDSGGERVAIAINPKPKRHKYRAIPCIVTADLTLYTREDILQAVAASGRDYPEMPLKKLAALVGILGDWFGSTKEAKCWIELKRRESAGEIQNLDRQAPYPLYAPSSPGIQVEIARYIADFIYVTGSLSDGTFHVHVVDTKGQRTAMYKLKAKWLKLQSGITIEEV